MIKMIEIRIIRNDEEDTRCSYSHKVGLDLLDSTVIALVHPELVLDTLKRYSSNFGPNGSYLDVEHLTLYINFVNRKDEQVLLSPVTDIRLNAWEKL